MNAAILIVSSTKLDLPRPTPTPKVVAQSISGRDRQRTLPSKSGPNKGRSPGKPPKVCVVQGPARTEIRPASFSTRSRAWWLHVSLASCLLVLWLGYYLGPQQQHAPYKSRSGFINGDGSTPFGHESSKTYHVPHHPSIFDIFPAMSYSHGVEMDTFTLMNETTTALGEDLISSLRGVLSKQADLYLASSILYTYLLPAKCSRTPSSRWITDAERYRKNTGRYKSLPSWCASRHQSLETCLDAAAKARIDIHERLSTLRTLLMTGRTFADMVLETGTRRFLNQTILNLFSGRNIFGGYRDLSLM
ncbi:uncharacterized protein PgNI_09599 [Pyricularia grisea]|uniref:Uncharacterized protein n=1 Tax=Pyricularia grisea TaxID=148305 RepID=A0A6P8ARS8_PYRGI|nr:uncharacterized protein PgNI_09599 [Pyricularia grisea]TLD04839.1 hypothetical protein PgNI_09599 [Pyricularia grisea]